LGKFHENILSPSEILRNVLGGATFLTHTVRATQLKLWRRRNTSRSISVTVNTETWPAVVYLCQQRVPSKPNPRNQWR